MERLECKQLNYTVVSMNYSNSIRRAKANDERLPGSIKDFFGNIRNKRKDKTGIGQLGEESIVWDAGE